MDRLTLLADSKAARARLRDNRIKLAQNVLYLRATLERLEEVRRRSDEIQALALARLQSRLESMPVIEQAKGIIIEQSGGSPDEAFDVLCRASQRTNVKVRDLAADIVNRTQKTTRDHEGNGRVRGPRDQQRNGRAIERIQGFPAGVLAPESSSAAPEAPPPRSRPEASRGLIRDGMPAA